MANEYIGVFDSGLGGLTAVKEIMSQMPEQPIIYFGDTGRVPYGTRGRDTIIKYVKSDIRFLESFGVKAIVVACGTASAVALPHIEKNIPIIGVVEATTKAAADATKNGKIGVIGTTGTIKSNAYEINLKKINDDFEVYSNACPLFVPLVENGYFDSEATKFFVCEYLSDIKAAGVDTLILGCTHYPLLKGVISEFMGSGVTLIDAGAEVARYIKELGICGKADDVEDKYRFYVSDNIESFEELGGVFLQQKIVGQVKKIDIEKY